MCSWYVRDLVSWSDRCSTMAVAKLIESALSSSRRTRESQFGTLARLRGSRSSENIDMVED